MEDKVLPATFTVTSLLDAGVGSLRAAITAANTAPSTDTITFSVAGTINLASALPPITGAVTVDGWTAPGFQSTPIVELNGTSAGTGANGLTVSGENVTVRGLVVNGFDGCQIQITGRAAKQAVVVGNYLGTNTAGTAAVGASRFGVQIAAGASNNRIGTNGDGVGDAAERNVISGNSENGILVTDTGTDNNVLAGNFIGLTAAGTALLANGGYGVRIANGATNTRVGTDTSAVTFNPNERNKRNVIAGKVLGSVEVTGSATTGTVIAGNYLGSNAAGTADFSQPVGVRIASGASGNTVGGAANATFADTLAVPANRIRGFTVAGVQVQDTSTNNAILGNSIVGTSGLAIDLGTAGTETNDPLDADTGANNLQNSPTLTGATIEAGTFMVRGSLRSLPNQQYRIEVFASDEETPLGSRADDYAGSRTVTTDPNGSASFTVIIGPGALTNTSYRYFSATATHLGPLAPAGTSEVSNTTKAVGVAVQYDPSVPPDEEGTVDGVLELTGPLREDEENTLRIATDRFFTLNVFEMIFVDAIAHWDFDDPALPDYDEGFGEFSISPEQILDAEFPVLFPENTAGGVSVTVDLYFFLDGDYWHMAVNGNATTVITPVPDRPTAVVANSTISATSGISTPLGLRVEPSTDQDGSESHGLILTGFPAGVQFSAGDPAGPGRWFVPSIDVDDLAVRVPAGLTPDNFTLTATPRTNDAGVMADWPDAAVSVQVTAVPADMEIIGVPTVTAFEDENAVIGFELRDIGLSGPPSDSNSYRLKVTATDGLVGGLTGGLWFGGQVNGTTQFEVTSTSLVTLNAVVDALTVSLPPQVSGIVTVTVELTGDGRSAITSTVVSFRPVPDEPPLTLPPGNRVFIDRGVEVPLGLILGPSADQDGSESHFVDIDLSALGGYVLVEEYVGDDVNGDPIYEYHNEYNIAPYTVSSGEDLNGDGTFWRVPRSALPGLTLTVDPSFPSGLYDATVTPHTRDAGVTARWATRPLTLAIRGSSYAPIIDSVFVDNAVEDIDAPVYVSLEDSFDDGLPYTVTLAAYRGALRTDVADGYNVTVVGGNGTSMLTLSGTLTDLQNLFNDSGIRYVPEANFAEVTNLSGSLEAPDGTVDSETTSFDVRPVADSPSLGFEFPAGVVGRAGGEVSLGLLFTPSVDQDGSETHVVEIRGLPAGSELSAGSNDYGDQTRWRVSSDDIPGLSLTLPTSLAPGDYSLEFHFFTTDVGDIVSDNAEWDLGELTLTVPDSQPPVIGDIGPFESEEDSSTPLTFDLGSTVDDGGTYTTTVSVPSGSLFANSNIAVGLGVGIDGNLSNALTLTGALPDLHTFLDRGGLVFFPIPYFSGTTSVAFTLTAQGGASGSTTSAIWVYPIASVPVITASSIEGLEGSPIPVPIDLGNLPDTDGSESVTVTIEADSGTVAGFVDFNGTTVGTETAPNVWEFTAASTDSLLFLLAGLRVVPAAGYIGEFDLRVTAMVQDVAAIGTGSWVDIAEVVDTIGVTVHGTGAPEVFDRGSYQTPENQPLAITYGLDDDDDPGGTYTVRIHTFGGTLTVDATGGVTVVSGNGTTDLSLSGTLDALQLLLDVGRGVVFSPDAYRNGFSPVELTLTAPNGVSAAVTSGVRVKPVAGTPELFVSDTTVGVGQPPTPLTITLTGLTDPDGSEIAVVLIAESTGTILGFVDSTGTPVGVPEGYSQWKFTASSFAALQAMLGDLRVVIPTDYDGSLALDVTATFTDRETDSGYFDEKTTTRVLTVDVVAYPPEVTLAPVTDGVEGAAWTVAFTVSDLDAAPNDEYTVTLTTPLGTWTGVDVAALAANGITVTGLGTGSLAATGSLDRLQTFFRSAAIAYDADPYYSGTVPDVTVCILDDSDGRSNTATTAIRVAPVASSVVPTATNAEGDEETTIPLSITVPTPPDRDGSESVTVLVRGVPAGARLSRGTDLGGGTWSVNATDLAALAIEPPPLFAGTISLTAAAVVTDTVTLTSPLFGSITDTSESSPVPFTVTVRARPTIVRFDGGTIAENSPSDSRIGQLTASGGHTGESFTFRLVSSTGYDVVVRADGDVRVGSQVFDFETRPGFEVTIEAVGSRGTRQTQTYPITVLNVNEPPAIAGGAVAAREDTPAAITGIVVSDPDILSEPLRVQLAVTHGSLTLVAGVGITLTNNGTARVTLEGTLAAVNAVLAAVDGVTYQPTADYSGPENLTITADDLGGTGAGGPNVVRVDRAFPVAPIADLPDLTVSDAAGDEDTAIPLAVSASVTDRDGSESVTVLVRGVPTGARLSRGTDLGGGTWSVNATDLAAVAFIPAPDASGVYELSFEAKVTDSAPEIGLRDTASRFARTQVTVRPVADVPQLTVHDLDFEEGSEAITGFSAASGDRDGSESLSIALFGVPDGVVVSGGQHDPARSAWLLTPDEFASLRLIAYQDTDGLPAEWEAVATSLEANGSTAETRTTFRVTVRNVAPVLTDVLLGPQIDGHVTIDLGMLTDPGREPFWGIEIDWGDGLVELERADETGLLGQRTHEYSTPGRYSIQINVSDDDAQTSTGLFAEWVVLPPEPPGDPEPPPSPEPQPVPEPRTPEIPPSPPAPTPPQPEPLPPEIPPSPPAPTPPQPEPLVPTPPRDVPPTLPVEILPRSVTPSPTPTVTDPSGSLAPLRVTSFATIVVPPSDSVALQSISFPTPTDATAPFSSPSPGGSNPDSTPVPGDAVGISGGSPASEATTPNDHETVSAPIRPASLAPVLAGSPYATASAATLATGDSTASSSQQSLVLLDPTAPQAGFSESYGESFELFERMTHGNVVVVTATVTSPENARPFVAVAVVPVPVVVAATAATAATGSEQASPPSQETDTTLMWSAVVGLVVASGVVAYRPAWSTRVYRMLRGWLARRTTP